MDTLALRVVARYVEARRAIPFDVRQVKQTVGQLAEEAIDNAVLMNPEGQPIGKNLSLAKTTLKLKHVKGFERGILVVIDSRPAPSARPTAGGGFEAGRNTIRLYLNANWPPEALKEQKWQIVDRMQNMGIHEVTHALDVLKEDAEYEGAGGDPKVYYNQPSEVRAYARQVVDEVETALRKLKSRARRTKAKLPEGGQLIERLLVDSPTWRDISPHLNRQNDRLIRQIVVRELQDANHLV